MAVSGSIRMSFNRCCAFFVTLAVLVVVIRPVSAYTPTDPVVTKMVDRGLKYLEKEGGTLTADGDVFGASSGEVVLVGYAHHKVVHDPNTRWSKGAIGVAKKLVADLEAGRGADSRKRNYDNVGLRPAVR